MSTPRKILNLTAVKMAWAASLSRPFRSRARSELQAFEDVGFACGHSGSWLPGGCTRWRGGCGAGAETGALYGPARGFTLRYAAVSIPAQCACAWHQVRIR